jgi:hypothetical protein
MRDQRMVPSQALPDFLKSELRVGEAGQWPLLSALDEGIAQIGMAAFARVFDLAGATASHSRRETQLRALGWEVDALSDAQRAALYTLRYRLLESRGTLCAVDILAEIYFPGAQVALGRPFAPSRLGASSKVTLVDRSDRRHVVFVRTVNTHSQTLCAEFTRNAATLLPKPFEAVVAFPKGAPEQAQRWSLTAAQSVDQRRVPCLILPR